MTRGWALPLQVFALEVSLLAALLAFGCSAPRPPDSAGGPTAGECWTLTGTGPIGDTSEGYLCVKMRKDSRCWTCVTHPPPPPDTEP